MFGVLQEAFTDALPATICVFPVKVDGNYRRRIVFHGIFRIGTGGWNGHWRSSGRGGRYGRVERRRPDGRFAPARRRRWRHRFRSTRFQPRRERLFDDGIAPLHRGRGCDVVLQRTERVERGQPQRRNRRIPFGRNRHDNRLLRIVVVPKLLTCNRRNIYNQFNRQSVKIVNEFAVF